MSESLTSCEDRFKKVSLNALFYQVRLLISDYINYDLSTKVTSAFPLQGNIQQLSELTTF